MSGLELRRVRQINRGTADIGLSGDQETTAVRGITGVGTHTSRQDPQHELLSEVINRINTVFGWEFADPQVEGDVIREFSAAYADRNGQGDPDRKSVV